MSSSGSCGTPPRINRATRTMGRHCSWSATSGASSPSQNDPSVVGSRLTSVTSPFGHGNNPGHIWGLVKKLFKVLAELWEATRFALSSLVSSVTNKGHIEAPTNETILRSFDVKTGCAKSFYAKLFPGIRLDCHRELVYWVGKYSDEASDLLDTVLPIEGPVVAVDLAYLLASVVLTYDLKDMMLPTVYEVSIMGAKFLHFDDNYLTSVRDVIVELFCFNGYVGAGALDPMHMINTAASVGAATIASNQASTMFRVQLDQMVEVQIMLSEEEEQWIKRDRSQVYFSRSKEVSHDHPYLAACREIIRSDFDRTFNLKTTELSVLILGASSREYKKYNNNANVSFQFAALEGKDSERVLNDCFKAVKNLRVKKIKKAKNKATAEVNQMRLQTADQVMKEFRETRKLPKRFLLWEDTKDMLKGKLDNNYSVLVFQDVGYNFDASDWGNLFRHTGALLAYGYMCLPWELLYPDIVSPPGYVYRVRGDTAYMGYHGYSNGYVHKVDSWKTLMSNVLLRCGDFNIGVEFASRVGPLTLVKMFRCDTDEYVARHLELPEHLKSVLVLDVHKSYDRMRAEINIQNLVYFPVRAEEFNEAVNYGLDISKESLSFSNILLYIRRRTSGISLVTKSIAKTWTVDAAMIPPFSMVVYLYVRFLTQEYLKIQDYAENKRFTIAGQYLMGYGKGLKGTLRHFFDLFKSHDMFPLLVKNVDHSLWQESASKLNYFRKKPIKLNVGPNNDPFLDDTFDVKEEEDEAIDTTCAFCEELKDVCGEQLFTCNRNIPEDTFHTFTLTSSELNKLRTSLNDTSKDPVGLKTVKENAARFVPLSTFQHRIRVKYLCGPPGTGKSHIIRALGTNQSLVLVPFSRLKSDYTNFTHPITKKKSSLKVHTQHAGFAALNHTRIFVDEYTAMPYEYLAVIAYNCGAEEVVFVGDHRQTSLINEVEGISIESKVQMAEMRSHELIKNFRNPSDAVNVLNRNYGYFMLPTNKRMGFKFDEPENFDKYPNHTPIFFTNATAKSFGMSNEIGDRVTVRANQGATYENVKLAISGNDSNLFNMSSMGIVALSRHTNECVILVEKGTQAAHFAAAITTSMRRITKISPTNISPVFTREEQIRLMEGDNLEEQPKDDLRQPGDDNNEDNNQDNNDGDDKDDDGKDDKPKKGGASTSGCKDDDDDDDDDDDNDNNQGRSWYSWLRTLYYRFMSRFFTSHRGDQGGGNNKKTTKSKGKEKQNDGESKKKNVPIMSLPLIRPSPKTKVNPTVDHSFNTLKSDVSSASKIPTTLEIDESVGDEMVTDVDSKVAGSDVVMISEDVIGHTMSTTEQATLKTNDQEIINVDTNKTGDQITFDMSDGKTQDIQPKGPGNEDVEHGLNITQEGEKQVYNDKKSALVDFNTQDSLLLTQRVEQIDQNLVTPPVDNTCLLICLSQITVNPLDVVWHSMVLALGEDTANVVYNKPLSTDELNAFCNFNKVSIMVVSDYTVVTCGIVSTYLGTIYHSMELKGHFYLKGSNNSNPLVLRLNSRDVPSVNHMGDQIFNNNRWAPTFTYAELNSARLLGPSKISLAKELDQKFFLNPFTTNAVKDCIGLVKPIETLTMKEAKTIVAMVPLTSRQLTMFVLVVNLTRNKRFWNEFKKQISTTQPYTQKLEGAGVEQVISVNNIRTHGIKQAPPEPFQQVDKGFEEMARLFTQPTMLKTWLVDQEVDSEFEHVPLEQSPYDCFKMLVEEFATSDEHDFAITNQETIGYVDEEFGNGVFDLTTLDWLNQRKNPKGTVEKSWCLLNVAPGVTYYKSNLSQSLHCLQARYLTKAYVSVFSTKSVDKAREIADLFFDEHMSENYDIFNEQDITVTSHESEHAMILKNYQKQTTFEMHSDNSVRFSMKDIFKPFKTKVDLFKAGQGISAWSKDMQTIFQTSFRVINKHFINSLKPHVVYDNGIDEYQLMARINILFAALPSISINGVIDATACDSGQNLFTQQIERRILERLGVRDDFLDWYYQQRESYVMKGYGVIAKVKEIKTSGEPATLLNNTILMACLMNYIIRGEGPCVIVIKGDDGLKRQANMCYRASVVEDLKSFLKMQFKVDIDVPITFCGYFLAGSTLLPDIVRKCFKIVGHKFRDYEHFCEYQQSLRDWVLVVNKLGLAKIVAITAMNYGMRVDYCYNLFYSIVSLTHIGKKQFNIHFKLRVIDLKEDFVSTTPWSEKLPWYKGSN